MKVFIIMTIPKPNADNEVYNEYLLEVQTKGMIADSIRNAIPAMVRGDIRRYC